MNNSFYYFFSSTPQVLGGVLALFGVFIIFKIQSSRSLLIGIAQTIINENSRYNSTNPDDYKLIKGRVLVKPVVAELQDAINKGDTKEINNIIKYIDNPRLIIHKERYVKTYHSLRSLIRNTIIWSVFTAIAIVICLLILPFGCNILNHPRILNTLFCIVLFFIIGCFSGLISILINALKE
jgi:hypothetical protein